jgi:hypothetical protein
MRLSQFPIGELRIGSTIGENNVRQKICGSYANPSYQAHGLMTSANDLIRGLKHGGDPRIYHNYGSLGNHNNNNNFGYGVEYLKMGL